MYYLDFIVNYRSCGVEKSLKLRGNVSPVKLTEILVCSSSWDADADKMSQYPNPEK